MKSSLSIATESHMKPHALILKTPRSPGFWLRPQLDDDPIRAERENGKRIQPEVQPHAA
jgi:hypothetical protein